MAARKRSQPTSGSGSGSGGKGDKKKGEGLQRKVVASNRKARHTYHILETVEAGLSLTGSEVKSLRAGHADITEAYVVIRDGEAFLQNADIQEYAMGGYANHPRRRSRKLLLHRPEIRKLESNVKLKGCTLVPLSIYFGRSGYAKAEVALVKGKQLHDRREDSKKKDAEREIRRHVAR